MTTKDPRIAYGVGCTWWDSIYKVGATPPRQIRWGNDPPAIVSLPCCPFCRGLLREVENIDVWNAQVQAYDREDHPGYAEVIAWGRGRCFSGYDELEQAFRFFKGEKIHK